MTSSLLCLTFKEPILQPKLESIGIGVSQTGIIFSLETITFVAACYIMTKIPEKKKNFKICLLIGLVFFFFALIFTGPVFFLPNNLGLIITGILLGGIGGAMINVNHVSALIEVYNGQDLD
jgi:MFS family permease